MICIGDDDMKIRHPRNQLADANKLHRALQIFGSHGSAQDPEDAVGAEFVAAGLFRPGRTQGVSVQAYLAKQRAKPKSGQSHRAYARNLRELFEHMELVGLGSWALTPRGLFIASQPHISNDDLLAALIRYRTQGGGWRVRPLRILLEIASRGSTPRPAFVAAFAAQTEASADISLALAIAQQIRMGQPPEAATGASASTVRDAVKVFPPLAESIGLINADGSITAAGDIVLRLMRSRLTLALPPSGVAALKHHRSARVTPITPRTGPGTTAPQPPDDLAELLLAKESRLQRLERRTQQHDDTLTSLKAHLEARGYTVRQTRLFDALALNADVGLEIEVKSLAADETAQIVRAIGQLTYYHHFELPLVSQAWPQWNPATVIPVTAFNAPVSLQHMQFLTALHYVVLWLDGSIWRASTNAPQTLL